MTGRPTSTSKPPAGLIVMIVTATLLFCMLVVLGWWQIERRQWKLALIAQVERRIHAAPTPAPGPDRWARITSGDAYRRVSVWGRFQGPDTLVQAATELGAGYWVVTPLRERRGFTVLVNRGFIVDLDAVVPRPAYTVALTGLLRLSEPGGAFLHHNDLASGRWYSRDVAAIAAARRIGTTAPYFIDADAVPGPSSPNTPVGGLTVVQFTNNHLVYAITWFTLAAVVAGGAVMLLRRARSPTDTPNLMVNG